MRYTIAVASVTLLGISVVEAAPSTETIAGNCAVCHAAKESGQRSIPHISGTQGDVIARELAHFKTDQRHGTIMNRIAKALSDAQIQDLAAHFAKQTY